MNPLRPRGADNTQADSAESSRYERWTANTERPLLVLAVLFLVVLAAPVVFPGMPPWLAAVLGVADLAIWAAFAVDYVVRLALVKDRRTFVLTHKIELAAVAVPALRPLRLLRLVSVGQMLAQRGRRNSRRRPASSWQSRARSW